MKLITLAVFLFFLVPLLAEPSLPTVPSFLWSNTEYFTGINNQALFTTTASDLAMTLSRVRSSENPLSRFIIEGSCEDEQLEVIVIYIEPQLTTSEFAHLVGGESNTFEQLKTLISTSKSSLTVPYGITTTHSFGSSVASKLIPNLRLDSHLIIATNDASTPIPERKGTEVMTLEQLKQAAESPTWEILHNGMTDLIIVYFSSPAYTAINEMEALPLYISDDSVIGKMNSALMTTSYVSLFTGNMGYDRKTIITQIPESHRSMSKFEERFTQSVSDNTNWPDTVLSGLYISALLLSISFVGICCTFNIQSSLRFESDSKLLVLSVAKGNE